MMLVKHIFDWLKVRDYKRSKDQVTRDVVRRYSRGNIALQNGAYMVRADLDALREKAKLALQSLNDE